MDIIEINSTHLQSTLHHYVACIGYFDGLHKGHQALLQKTREIAHESGLKSALITFDPDPWVVIKGDRDIRHITTIQDRIEIAEQFGMDAFFIIRFTREFSLLEPEDFIDKLIRNYGVRHLVCGYDFHFGKGGQGDTALLKSIECDGFSVTIVEKVSNDHVKVSSSLISQNIQNGLMEAAEEGLGRPYTIRGFVIGGRRQGSKIGFPTANLAYSSEYLLPKNGVYFGITTVKGKSYRSMINVGHNPTFNHRSDVSIETNILDFNTMIYGEEMSIAFLHYSRPELKLSSVDELIKVMNQDRNQCVEYFNEHPIT